MRASLLASPSPARYGVQESTPPFHLFKQFPELRVGLFGKEQNHGSDETCAARLGFANVAKLNQSHGNVVHVGDGLITSAPNLALSVRFADCQNFVVYAPRRSLSRAPARPSRSDGPARPRPARPLSGWSDGESRDSGQAPCGVLGVLHVGWRGLAKGAITAFYEKLWKGFAIPPEATFVGAGPSLCKRCATFSNPFEELPKHFHPFVDGFCVDLVAAAEAELDALGVPSSQRERHPACTKCDGAWHSFRRDRNSDAGNYLVAGMSAPPS